MNKRTPSQILAVISVAFDYAAESDYLFPADDVASVRARYAELRRQNCVGCAAARQQSLVEWLGQVVVVAEPTL